MRLLHLLTAVCVCHSAFASLPLARRALHDVFDGFDSANPLETHAAGHDAERPPTLPTRAAEPAQTHPTPFGFAAPFTSSATTTKSKESGNTLSSNTGIATSIAPGSHSVIGTIPPLPSITPWSANQMGSVTSQPPPASPTSTVKELPTTNQNESRSMQEWKIVGVAVIAFTTVAAILLLSVFFDQWWGFLRDLFWKKRRKDSVEELIPDWEKASWEIRLGADRHRYPSMPPGAVTKLEEANCEKGRATSLDNFAGVGSGIKHEPRNSSDNQAAGSWAQGLGLLTPVPPALPRDRTRPPGLSTDGLRHHDSGRLNTSRIPPSPALTDPYGGIE